MEVLAGLVSPEASHWLADGHLSSGTRHGLSPVRMCP